VYAIGPPDDTVSTPSTPGENSRKPGDRIDRDVELWLHDGFVAQLNPAGRDRTSAGELVR
jgi:hypothetical protein